MISVAKALAFIKEQQVDFGVESIDLQDSIGRILAQEIVADRDFPSYDRVTMDGIAIDFETFLSGKRSFKIESTQAAGKPQLSLDDSNNCIEMMTGAMLPNRTDTVIPYEDCSIENNIATVNIAEIHPKQNIHFKGTDGKENDLLLASGKRITSSMIGIMATVGQDKIMVQRLPKIAICSTGDELIDITETPLPHQIRKSNSFMLEAALREEGIVADSCHLPDDKEAMRMKLSVMKDQYDVLLFSGAVSKGKYDFLPEVLADLEMKTIFHSVAQRPGKPFLFGQFDNKVLVFGFPGNPVSTMVCYKIFFEPWLYQTLKYKPEKLTAQLGEQVIFKPSLTYHLLVKLDVIDGVLIAYPAAGSSSGDMISLEAAAALLTIPADKIEFKKGEVYPLTLLSKFTL